MQALLNRTTVQPEYNPVATMGILGLSNFNNECEPSNTETAIRHRELNPELSSDSKSFICKIKSFEELKGNWDSYGASAISKIAINNAIKFVKKTDEFGLVPYFVSPGRNQDVLIEYQNETGKSVEIYFNSDGTNELIFFENDDAVYDGDIEKDLLKFQEFIYE